MCVIDYLPYPSLCGLPSPFSSSCITPSPPHPHTRAIHSPSFPFPLSISTLCRPSPLAALFIMYTLHVVHISSHYTSERERESVASSISKSTHIYQMATLCIIWRQCLSFICHFHLSANLGRITMGNMCGFNTNNCISVASMFYHIVSSF